MDKGSCKQYDTMRLMFAAKSIPRVFKWSKMTKLNIKVYRDLMGANDLWAERTRALLKKHHVIMLNLIGSPGAIRIYKVSLGSITG